MSKLDFTTSKNPWGEHEKHRELYSRVLTTHEALLAELAVKLNEIHETQHSLRYWRIVVGGWLLDFVQIFFHRWQVLSEAVDEYESAHMKVRFYGQSIPAAVNSQHFISSIRETGWNERLFHDLALFLPQISLAKQVSPDDTPVLHSFYGAGEDSPRNAHSNPTKRKKRIYRKRKVHMSADFLSPLSSLRLSVALGQIPRNSQTPPVIPLSAPNPSLREWDIGEGEPGSYQYLIGKLVASYLPVSFLEGYQVLKKHSRDFYAEIKPQVVTTANSHFSNDAWKFFAGESVEAGAKLVIQQHGGFYGVGDISPRLDWELSISDRFLSWGWKSDSNPKIYPAPAGRILNHRPARRKKRPGKLLHVLTHSLPIPRILSSTPTGEQFEDYLNEQFDFFEKLSHPARQSLRVREPSGLDEFWAFRDRAMQREIKLVYDQEIPFLTSLRGARLVVISSNSTTLLQAFALNVPTVIFWNPEHWALSKRAQPHFDDLRDAGVLFFDAEGCSHRVNEVWDDPQIWWHSPRVQTAVKTFCKEFAHVGVNPILGLKSALTSW